MAKKFRSADAQEEVSSKSKGARTKGDLASKTRRRVKKQKEEVDEDIDDEEEEKEVKVKKAKKKAEKSGMTRTQQGHMIQSLMAKSPLNVKQICEKTGLSEERVQGHVEYEVDKGRAHIDKKGRVIVDTQPNYRSDD